MTENLRHHLWAPPPPGLRDASNGERKLDGPRYVLSVVKSTVSPDSIAVVTTQSDDDLAELGWSTDDIADFIRALIDRYYHCSEWAMTSNKTWIDCDAYVMGYDEDEKRPHRDRPRFFLKFGFRNNDALNRMLIVSCHLEKSQ